MEPNGRDAEHNEKLKDSSRSTSLSSEHDSRNAKATKILKACEAKDIEALRKLATSERGLVSDELRRQACSYHHGKLQRPND
jgi:hypothetical protein